MALRIGSTPFTATPPVVDLGIPTSPGVDLGTRPRSAPVQDETTAPVLRPPPSSTTTRGDRQLQANLLQQRLLAQVTPEETTNTTAPATTTTQPSTQAPTALTPAERREVRDRVVADDAKVRESLSGTLTTLDKSLSDVPGYRDRLRVRLGATDDGTTRGVTGDVTVTTGRVAVTGNVTHTEGPEGGVTSGGVAVNVGLGPSDAEREAAQKQRAAEAKSLDTLGTKLETFMDALDKVSSSGATAQEKSRLVEQQLLPRLEILSTLAAASLHGEGQDTAPSARYTRLATSLVDAPLGVMRELVRAGGGDTSRLDAAAIVRASGATP
jgi:hypothetical protein